MLPTLWFRNTWSWGRDDYKPEMHAEGSNIISTHRKLGTYHLYCNGNPELLFCENETNGKRLYGKKGLQPIAKDGINDYIVQRKRTVVNKSKTGTKAAAHYNLMLRSGETVSLQLRLSKEALDYPFHDFDAIFWQRLAEADGFMQTNSGWFCRRKTA